MLETIQATYIEAAFAPGLCIPMGRGKSWWRVLEVKREEQTAILIAERSVGEQKYHDKWEPITWETCALRWWLNEVYYDKTFTEEEKEAILESEISNPDNPKYHTKGGNDTKDKLYLLSLDEVRTYFKNDEERATGAWWWLRSPGYNQDSAACVGSNGGVRDDGSLGYNYCAVRPAFKINLKSSFFQSLIADSTHLIIKVPDCQIVERKLMSVRKGQTAITIPEGVTEIGESCFKGMGELGEVIIPETVRRIEKEAFSGCTSLRQVKLPGIIQRIYDTDITEVGEKKLVRIGDCVLQDHTLYCQGMTEITIPEGVTEIGERCFVGMGELRTVILPSTLKKIAKEAFRNCTSLEEISGGSGAITYGKDVFCGCSKLKYTPDMFRNAGKLPDSIASHMENCGPEEYAWILMYQKGAVWEQAMGKAVNADHAPEILTCMTEHIKEQKKSPKKAATAAVDFVIKNALLLSKEGIEALIEVLKSKKLAELAESLQSDPTVSQMICAENGKPQNDNETVPQSVQPDGSIWYGIVKTKLAKGACFWMGSGGTSWRILSIDENSEEALVIADESIGNAQYHDKGEDITWENCTLRRWLNGEYYEKTFHEEEKEAILESEISNSDNPKYHTKGGNDTKDKLYLLSLEEVQTYFKNDEDRATGEWWWLRSPGFNQKCAADVISGGYVYVDGYVVSRHWAVRPAFKINLKSSFFQSLISSESNGEVRDGNPMLVIKAGKVVEANQNCTEVRLPDFVKEIGEGAFKRCALLTKITWNGTAPKIDENAFEGCPNLRLPEELYLDKKLQDEKLADYIPEEAGPAVIANLFILAGKKSRYRSRAIELLNEANACQITDEILRITAAMKALKSVDNILRFAFAVSHVLDPARSVKLIRLLSAYKECEDKIGLLRREVINAQLDTGIVRYFFSAPEGRLSQTYLSDRIMEQLPSLSAIFAAAGDYAEMYGRGWVETKNFKKEALAYTKNESCHRAAEKLDHEILMEVLRTWQRKIGPAWYAPYAAFASEAELADLIKEMKQWAKDKKLKEQIIRVRGAILLNDTGEAMRYADSLGLLGRYAELRGLDEDTVRDSMMSDMGLDVNGHRSWTLAGKTYTAVLNKDLTITLTDDNGKAIRSIPKKDADPAEHAAISKEFNAMKKDIKPTAKLRNDKIFADFLSGRARKGAAWKKAYLENPLLRLLAQLIVWEQDGHTFLLHEDGKAYDVNDVECPITDDDIRVAHPMDMGTEVTESWQHYFNAHDRKQPFEQVWEPVADAALVKPGRYDGCTVPLYMLMNKEKHGIIMEGQSRIILKDCSAGLQLLEGHHDWYNNDFEVQNFTFKEYTRQVNHIVVHLDKATVAGRIKKDDVSVVQWLDLFTMAQIMEFIELATENEATNVTALLLQYKQENFENFDPMDEFTLDLL